MLTESYCGKLTIVATRLSAQEDMAMIFILGSTASDDTSEFACDYAVIELTPQVAQTILARMDALLMLYDRNRSLHEFHFLDREIRFFQREFDDDRATFVPRDGSQFAVADAPAAAANGIPLSTECEHMVVAINGHEPEVYWRARMKDSSLRMETCSLAQSEVLRLINGASIA